MVIRYLAEEDFVNYKKPSLFLAFPECSWKCERECGKRVCQNSALATSPLLEINEDVICDRYVSNDITKAIVCAGLEPFDTFEMLCNFINIVRNKYQCNDDIVIYTGYTEQECEQNSWIEALSVYRNIIVKFGRYIPDNKPHKDEVLGVNLASDNQYAKKIC